MRSLPRCVKRMVIGILLFAGTIAASVVLSFVSLMTRFRRRVRLGVPGGPEAPSPEGERSMDEIMKTLGKVPFKPAPMVVGIVKGGLEDVIPGLLDVRKDTAGYIYPYPGEFDEVTIESFDGARLAAAVGLHRDGRPRPGLVISHGYMGSKNDHNILGIALNAFADWGFNVLAIDLRDFGRSQGLGFNPMTMGWKEGEDLLAAARYLGEQPNVTSVGITGFSMGAISTMRAAYMAREHPYLTGGALAWNGVSDIRRMIPYLDNRPAPSDEFFPFYFGFRLMHLLRRADMKRHVTEPEVLSILEEPFCEYDFASYLGRISAPHYGVSYDEILTGASSREFLADIDVPLLVIHAADDPICPPSEMDDLIEIEEINPNLRVWMMPAGNHCMFAYLDRNWFDSVLKGFFEYWADWGNER